MPARRLDALELQSPSGNVRGVTIPHNINLSKGLQSPWTVPRTCMEYIFTINNVSLWARKWSLGALQPQDQNFIHIEVKPNPNNKSLIISDRLLYYITLSVCIFQCPFPIVPLRCQSRWDGLPSGVYICPQGDWSRWGYNPRQAMLEGLQSPITLTCPRGYNSLGQFLELAWIIFTINYAMSVCILQCPFSDCSFPLLALMRWVGGETISCSLSYLSQV